MDGPYSQGYDYVQGGGGPQKTKTPYVDQKTLDACTQALFGVELRNFTPSGPGRNGSFTGYGPDVINKSGNHDTVLIATSILLIVLEYGMAMVSKFFSEQSDQPNSKV
jgi:hypothetical protein